MITPTVVGLIPAAGSASRLQPLPCSKELFPVGFETQDEGQQLRPKVVSAYLLEQMQKAGARQVYFILRKGKWDIPAYFGDGSQLQLHLAYLIMKRPYGAPYSLDQANAFVNDKTVLFGFPDILIEPKDAFGKLLQRQVQTRADVVLGAFAVHDTSKWDMLELEQDGQVKHVYPKTVKPELKYGWAMACWSPRFTQFMHRYLEQEYQQMQESKTEREVSVGEVVQAAIQNGLVVQSVCFHSGNCLDVGTSEDLRTAIRKLT
ncbi:nucleotidyltransferase family protein [Pontibacter sp. MBLB2868]|uniref:nucleotidyltransferase family protein n=1 Tax=Pontibacter sp. MBLB2868 TaxID=3451555 RepID=UPI003F74DCD2